MGKKQLQFTYLMEHFN